MSIFRKKSVSEAFLLSKEKHHRLKRSLSAWNIAFLCLSSIIGAGIFSVTAKQAALVAGPSIIISFVIAATVCFFAALCYVELASSVPVSGSAYTFSYISFGEIVAWIVGWVIVAEFAITTVYISNYWSGYFISFFNIPENFVFKKIGPFNINILVIIILVAVTILLAQGAKITANVSTFITVIKLGVILFLIVLGLKYINLSNFHPFIPESSISKTVEGSNINSIFDKQLLSLIWNQENVSSFGVGGIFLAASSLFLAFLGFDSVITTAEEVKNPKKKLPLGIALGVGLTTIVYILVSITTVGMVKYSNLAKCAHGREELLNLGTAFDCGNIHVPIVKKIIEGGALLGLTTVVVVTMLGLSRTIFAMSRDNLLPRFLSDTSKKKRVPVKLTIILGFVSIFLAFILPADILGNLLTICALLCFVIVSLMVPYIRKRKLVEPAFQIPFSPVLPIISALSCIFLMLNFEIKIWLIFIGWLLVGIIIYFLYSKKHSLLNK